MRLVRAWCLPHVYLLLVVVAAAAETGQSPPRQLSARDRAELVQKLQRFESLSVRDQRRIRELDQRINRDAESAALDEVATRYYRWLKQQTAGQRAELRELDPDDRIERIRRLQAAERAKKKRTLSETDQKAVLVWLREWIVRNGRGRMLSDRARHQFPENDHGVARDRQGRRPPNSARRERLEMMARAVTRVRPEQLMHLIETDDIRRLEQRLSSAARERLEQMPSAAQRKRLVIEWIRQAVRAAADRPLAGADRWTQERLENFFVEQIGNNDLREELLRLPRDEMLRDLRRLAARHDFQRSDRPPRRPRPEHAP
ncbi:MAG: hypothetical protein ACC645_00690 [Pirellulales bacterium]